MCNESEIVRNMVSKQWFANYQSLVSFYDRYGNVDVQKDDDKALYRWCKTQRKLLKSPFITDQMRLLLAKVNIV